MINLSAIYKGLVWSGLSVDDVDDELIDCTKEHSYHDRLSNLSNQRNESAQQT